MIASLLVLALALQPGGSTPTTGAAAASQPQASTIANDPSQPDADGVYHHLMKVAGMTPPRVIHQVEPAFSKEAKKKKINASVTVALVADAQGQPRNVYVIRSAAEDATKEKDRATYATLDAKAIEAVQQYRFEPARKDGNPVPVELRVVVNFQIF